MRLQTTELYKSGKMIIVNSDEVGLWLANGWGLSSETNMPVTSALADNDNPAADSKAKNTVRGRGRPKGGD